jgi:hypothetical protein
MDIGCPEEIGSLSMGEAPVCISATDIIFFPKHQTLGWYYIHCCQKVCILTVTLLVYHAFAFWSI